MRKVRSFRDFRDKLFEISGTVHDVTISLLGRGSGITEEEQHLLNVLVNDNLRLIYNYFDHDPVLNKLYTITMNRSSCRLYPMTRTNQFADVCTIVPKAGSNRYFKTTIVAHYKICRKYYGVMLGTVLPDGSATYKPMEWDDYKHNFGMHWCSNALTENMRTDDAATCILTGILRLYDFGFRALRDDSCRGLIKYDGHKTAATMREM